MTLTLPKGLTNGLFGSTETIKTTQSSSSDKNKKRK